MTAVVTGAAGHLGNTLVRALLAQGRRVRALVHRDRRALKGLDVEIIQGDVRDLASLRTAFDGARVVYHTAAHISLSMRGWPHLEAINVHGARNVVDACFDQQVHRLIHFSSVHALVQEPLDVPLDESRPLVDSRRCPPYDRSKAVGEMVVRQAVKEGLDAVTIYPAGLIGPFDFHPSYFGRVLLALCQKRLPVLVAGGFNWVDVRDVATGALQAEGRAPVGSRYLLPGHWVSMRELASMMTEITWTKAPQVVLPLWMARLGMPFCIHFSKLGWDHPLYTKALLNALCGNRMVSRERATRDLGYHPRPLRETLVDTFRWFAEAGRLQRPLAFHILNDT